MTRTPSRAEITSVILAVRAEYAANGIPAQEIGNGHCYDFAGDVLGRVIGDDWVHHEGKHGWSTLESEQLHKPVPGAADTVDATEWDWDLLAAHWNIHVPMDRRAVHDAIVPKNASHGWITAHGLHFDAEAPDGVADFFDLPFFQRWLQAEIGATR